MTAHPLIISSGWTLITLLIHVHLIWTDDLVIFILHGKKKKSSILGILQLTHSPTASVSSHKNIFAALLPAVFTWCLLKQQAREAKDLRQGDSIAAIVVTC